MLRTKKTKDRRQHWDQSAKPRWIQRRARFQKKFDENSNEESEEKFHEEFRDQEFDEKSREDSDENFDEDCDDESDKECNESKNKKWNGFIDKWWADVTFFKNLIQSFMFGQTAIAEHQLIYFDAGLLKYEGLTQILSKFPTKSSIWKQKIIFFISESLWSENSDKSAGPFYFTMQTHIGSTNLSSESKNIAALLRNRR